MSTSSSCAGSRATAAAAACRSSSDHVEFLSGVRAGETHGLAHRDAHPQPRLEELAGDHGSRRRAPRTPRRDASARSRRCAPATPISPASSSTIATTRATSSSAPRRARPRRASPPAPSAGSCSRSSVSPSARTSCTSAASTRRGRIRFPTDIDAAADRVAAAHARCETRKPTMIARIDAAKSAGDTLGGHLRGRRRRAAGRARQPRELGPEARRPSRGARCCPSPR